MRSFADPDDEWVDTSWLHGLTVERTEPEVLGVILGPDGVPLRAVFDRPVVSFGFVPSEDA